MKILYTLGLSWACILNSIDLSSQSDPWHERVPNPGTSQGQTSSSSRLSPDTTLSLGLSYDLSTPPPAAGPSSIAGTPRGRFFSHRSSDGRLPEAKRYCTSIFGYPLKELPFIRLVFYSNYYWSFEIGTFTFKPNTLFAFRARDQVYVPMPNEKQIVLLQTHGDIFAILTESSQGTLGLLLYRYMNNEYVPVKVNMYYKLITPFSALEKVECPIDNKTPLKDTFDIIHTHSNKVHARAAGWPRNFRS